MLGAGKNNFPGHKNEEDNPGFDHPVNKTGKQFRFVGTKLGVVQNQFF